MLTVAIPRDTPISAQTGNPALARNTIHFETMLVHKQVRELHLNPTDCGNCPGLFPLGRGGRGRSPHEPSVRMFANLRAPSVFALDLGGDVWIGF